MDFEECLNTTTSTAATANGMCHQFESSESGSDSLVHQRASNDSLSAEATASDSGINVAEDNESTCNLRKRLLRNETFINLINILKRVHDIDVRLIEIEFIADDTDEEASKGIQSDALRAEKTVKRQLERVRLEAEKRNLQGQMDSIKASYYCQLGSFQLIPSTRLGIRSFNQDFAPLSRKVSSESDHQASNSELDEYFEDSKKEGQSSRNVMEWAFRAKEHLQEGRLSALSPWDSEESQPLFSRAVAPPANARSPLLEENGPQIQSYLKSRVWNISADDDEDLQRGPFGTNYKTSLHQVVGKVPSSDSINNDAEMNQIVALVVNDPLQDLTDSLEFKANKKEQLSFDAECEMIKSLLRKSQVPSVEDEYVGSVSTLYPSETVSSTPTPSLPPPGFAKQHNFLTGMPSFEAGLSADSIRDEADDTLILLPTSEATVPGCSLADISHSSRDLSAMTSSPVQLFAGAALFALPALTSALDQNFYDEFCQNGQEVPSTPGWGAASFVRALPRPDNQGIATAAAENECGTARGTAAFSWASVTKSATGGSKGDSKFDVAAEQHLCRILEKFIEVFGCSYGEARALLELMQAKYDLLTTTPMDVIVNAARELLKNEGDRKKPVATTTTTTAAQPAQTGQQEEELPWNYKTVMCNFHKDGMCRLGDKCMFAHSKAELREPFIPNGFCIAFVTKGVCKWGSSCNYIHETPSVSKKQSQSSEKLKTIKPPESAASSKPRVPVGLNFVSAAPTLKSGAPVPSVSIGAAKAPSVCSTSCKADVPVPAEGNTAKSRNKSKKDKEKEDEEWSKVSRGAKPGRAPELRSPAAIVAAFQLDNLCVLCRDQVSASNNRITLVCGHSQFHRGCIKDWLKTQTPAVCPVCKSVSNFETDEALPEAASKKKK